MTCEELGLRAPMPATESKFAWTEKRRKRRPSPQHRKEDSPHHRRVVSGMLPTLQALAGFTCDSEIQKRGACLVPLEGNADPASHLQATLLEAYCREIGLKLMKIPERVLRDAFGEDHADLSCLLVLNDDNLFFLESPE